MRAEVDRGHTMSSRLAGPVTTGMRSHLQRIIAMLLPIRVQLACWALAAAAVSGCTGSLVASHHVASQQDCATAVSAGHAGDCPALPGDDHPSCGRPAWNVGR